MPRKSKVKIQLPVESFMPDTLQYKPWSPRFVPTNLLIEVEIPEEEVVSLEDGKTVLTPKGLTDIFIELSMAMEHAFEAFEIQLSKEIDKYKE